MVKPSAMREVAIEVPQVRRGQLATCRRIFILLLNSADLCQMNSFSVVRSQEVRNIKHVPTFSEAAPRAMGVGYPSRIPDRSG